MDESTDAEIWARVRAGSATSYAVVWDRHHTRVFQHLRSLGGDRDTAEDQTAVVFLELWRHRDTARLTDGSLLPWLLVTARNVHRNSVRSERRYRALLDRLPPPDATLHPDGVAERLDDRARLAHVLARGSSSTDRQLLEMTVLDGEPVAVAARHLGLTEAAAKMRLSRLRRRLRRATPAEGTTP